MNNLPKIISILLVSLVLINCSSSKKVVVQPTAPKIIEKERIVSKSFDAIWLNSIEWFATHNTPIKNLDKSSGLISTEYSVSIGEAVKYMECRSGNSTFMGKVEIANYTGNFNVLIKKLSDNSTKINVNVFFGATVNKYRYKNLLSTEYILESSTRTTCASTGALEKEILDYIEAGNQ